jgi:hypothetical protein
MVSLGTPVRLTTVLIFIFSSNGIGSEEMTNDQVPMGHFSTINPTLKKMSRKK